MIPLVIIDVQDRFLCELELDQGRYVTQVVKAIRNARRRRALIVVVQYIGEGKTTSRVLDALHGYKRQAKVYKRLDNGAGPVINCLKKTAPKAKLISVCGVNLDCCVRDTVEGLVYRGYSCRIVREATCNVWKREYKPADRGFVRRNFGAASYLTPDQKKNIKLRSVRSL